MATQTDPRHDRILSKWIDRHDTLLPLSRADGPLRYAVYIRKSTDDLHESSVERQREVTTTYANRMGFVRMAEPAEFKDIGRSGYTMAKRTGLEALLAVVRRRCLDVIVAEDLDRLSRHIGDASWLWRLCQHHGVQIHTPTLGHLGAATVAMHGFRGDEDRRRLISLMQQGRWQAAERGRMLRTASCYGYVQTGNAERPLEIDVHAADVVRRIFSAYVAGGSVRSIVGDLNRDGIAPPRSRRWNACTLIGSGAAGGILGRPLYVGLEIWGRLETKRDENFRKTRVRRATDDCIRIERPELRIVPPALWAAVAERLERERKGRAPRKPPVGIPDAPLLSGLVRCGCGRPMTYGGRSGTRERLVCSSNATGVADHMGSVLSADVERRILDIIRNDVTARRAVDDPAVGRGALPEVDRARIAARLRKRIRKLEERLASVFDADPESARSAAIAGRQRRRHAVLARLENELLGMTTAEAASPAETAFEDRLRTFLGPFPIRARAAEDIAFRDHLRSLIGSVVVTPKGRGHGYGLRVELAERLDGSDATGPDGRVTETTVQAGGIGFSADANLIRRLTEAAERGDFDLDDATWVMVEPLLQPLSGIRIGTRRLTHAAIFLALTGMPRRRAPLCFGPVETLGEQLRRLGSTGTWRRLVCKLVDLGWAQADRLRPDHYDLAPPSKRAVGLARQARAVAVLGERADRRASPDASQRHGRKFGKPRQAVRDGSSTGTFKKRGFFVGANRRIDRGRSSSL